MMKCRDLVKAVSYEKKLSQSARLSQWIQIKMHLLICVYCRAYVKQLRIMKDSFVNLLQGSEAQQTQSDAESASIQDLKNRILQKIN